MVDVETMSVTRRTGGAILSRMGLETDFDELRENTTKTGSRISTLAADTIGDRPAEIVTASKSSGPISA